MKTFPRNLCVLLLTLLLAVPARGQYVLDDVLRWVTPAAGLTLGAIGVPAEHDIRDQILVMGTSGAVVLGSVYGLKHIVKRERPDGSDLKSFPSGHAAVAFWGAEVVREEYGWGWGAGAYALAAGVSVLRVYHQQHWETDVLAGAAIGILSARIGYWLLPWERRLFGWDEDDPSAVLPTYNPQAGAVQLTFSRYF